MRCFIAVALPDACRARLGATQEDLRDVLPGVRWTRTGSMHLTLCFLGEIADPVRARLSDRLAERIPGAVPPLRLRAKGLGVFPSTSRPRVVWCGLIGEGPDAIDHLRRLHSGVREAVSECGIRTEGRPFRPHLTLGRFTRTISRHAVAKILEERRDADHGVIEVGAVRLYRSVLAPGGAVHSVLGEYPL